MMPRRVLLLALLLLAGCAYSFPGKGALPGDVSRLYVPLFKNATSEPLLENILAGRLTEVLARNENLTLVEQTEQADAVLEGTIRSYRSRALSYSQNDDISEYRSTMSVDVLLMPREGEEPLWKGTVRWDTDYVAADDKALQEDLEKEAMEELSMRLSEELLYQMIDDF